MHIRETLVNYLFDRDFIVSLYDDYIYFYNYVYLDSFDEKEIIISVKNRKYVVRGSDLTIVKMTKEELLIKGVIDELKVKVRDE